MSNIKEDRIEQGKDGSWVRERVTNGNREIIMEENDESKCSQMNTQLNLTDISLFNEQSPSKQLDLANVFNQVEIISKNSSEKFELKLKEVDPEMDQSRRFGSYQGFVPSSLKETEQELKGCKKLCGCCFKSKQHHDIAGLRRMPIKLRNRWIRVLRKLLMLSKIIRILKEVQAKAQIEGPSQKVEVDEGVEAAEFRLGNYSTYSQNFNAKKQIFTKDWLILPDSKVMMFWMLNLFVLLITTAVYVPYRLAFLNSVPFSVFIIELIVDFIFLFDIIINFFLAFVDDNNELILDRKIIIKRYLKSWFLIDVVSSIPVQLFETGGQQYNKAFRLLRLPRLYKLFKLLRVTRIFDFLNPSKFEEDYFYIIKLNSGMTRLLKVILLMAFFIHFYACLWYFIAKFDDFPPESWVMTVGAIDQSNFNKYLISFYWVLQTLTTVGYGDMPIGSTTERIFAIILMTFGVGFYSYTIGNLSSILSTIDSSQNSLNTKILSLNEFAHDISMPKEMYFKILRILQLNTKQPKLLGEDGLLDNLPGGLRNDVLSIAHRARLGSFSFFRNKSSQFIADCIPFLNQISLSSEEILFRKGDYADERRVGLVTQDGDIFRNFVEGAYFGDLELFNESIETGRYYSALTFEDTDVLVLKKEDLNKLFFNYPEVKEEMKQTIMLRTKRNECAIKIAKKAQFNVGSYGIKQILGINNNEFLLEDIKEIIQPLAEGSALSNIHSDVSHTDRSDILDEITSKRGENKNMNIQMSIKPKLSKNSFRRGSIFSIYSQKSNRRGASKRSKIASNFKNLKYEERVNVSEPSSDIDSESSLSNQENILSMTGEGIRHLPKELPNLMLSKQETSQHQEIFEAIALKFGVLSKEVRKQGDQRISKLNLLTAHLGILDENIEHIIKKIQFCSDKLCHIDKKMDHHISNARTGINW